MPILVAYDELKDGLWALHAGQDGANEEVIKWSCDVLHDCGYGRCDITAKSDQEPAIVSLRGHRGESRWWHCPVQFPSSMISVERQDGKRIKDIPRPHACVKAPLRVEGQARPFC